MQFQFTRLPANFWQHVDPCRTDGCAIWLGPLTKGYGRFNVKGVHSPVRVHRYVYELLVGPISEGLQIDHVKERGCTNRVCWWPEHLEPVTNQVNTKRGFASRTHCRNGHELTGLNTREGSGQCLTCKEEAYRRRYVPTGRPRGRPSRAERFWKMI